MELTRKVLAVDDAEFVQHIYRVCFRRLGGCTLLHAYNGREALEVLEREGIVDLIILDLNMPVMDGLQFLKEFRARPKFAPAHIMVASTENEDGLIRDALRAGAHSYIKKPFTLDQLLEFISRSLPWFAKRLRAP